MQSEKSNYSSRNHGWGRRLDYAVKGALLALFGNGKHATFNTHLARARPFQEYLASQGITDLRDFDQALLEGYALQVQLLVDGEDLKVSYAQNLLSTANIVALALTGNTRIRVKPSSWVGERSHIRTTPPASMDWTVVERCAQELVARRLKRASHVVLLARAFGLRLREACLADLERMFFELHEDGCINILDGTKGGRDADRYLPVEPRGRTILQNAYVSKPLGCDNLLRKYETFIQFVRGEIFQARPILKAHGIPGFHDLRAARAAEFYEQMTGFPAPVLNSTPDTVPKVVDRDGRMATAHVLGHNRIDVVAAYIGGIPR